MKKEQKIFLISAILLIAILAIIIINYINSPKPGELKQITYSELQELINNQEDFILIVSQSTCSHCMTYKPKVKIIAGPFTGMYGVIESVDSETQKLNINVDLFGQETSVEIEISQIEIAENN